MPFCIPKELVEAFKRKLKSGEIDPVKLADMTSLERRTLFTKTLGDANARRVNALFESKLLLKNQQTGIINWAKKVVGLKPEVLRDVLSKVERMEKVLEPKELETFLEDLAAQRLGFDITMAEAAKISELAKGVAEKKTAVSENSPIRSPERLEYGTALALFKEYVGDLKLNKRTFRDYVLDWKETVVEVAGITKSLLSTLDNSFFGRQGFKALFTNPTIWGRNFRKSWFDIGKELIGTDAMTPIRADVLSRPNAMNASTNSFGIQNGILTI